MLMRDHVEIAVGNKFSFPFRFADLSVFDDLDRRALNKALHSLRCKLEPRDNVVHTEQYDCTDDSSHKRIVRANDRILNRIRQREDNYKIERIKLRQFAFAEEPQHYDKGNIDQYRPGKLFEPRNR